MKNTFLRPLLALTFLLVGGFICPAIVHATSVGAPGVAFNTPVTLDNLDQSAFAEWVDGAEKPFDVSAKEVGAQWTIFTSTTAIGHLGAMFGASKTPGLRHLRIGFKSAVSLGSVIVKGGGRLSVLKPAAKYPGDLNNETDWLPAARLEGGGLSIAEVADSDFAVWVLPPGTATRALRFTHDAKITDLRYVGELDGALVSTERLGNMAPQAVATASVNSSHAPLLINGAYDGWKAWENQEKGKPDADSPVISPKHPEWIVLGWREPVRLTGLVALWAGVGAIEVQTYIGSADEYPAGANEAVWRTVGEYSGLKHDYPVQFLPNRLDFGREVTTRALRLRLIAPGQGGGSASNNGGRRIWMGEIMALTSLGSAPLQATKISPPASSAPTPPIAVKFNLKTPGYVTLVIEKPDGFRVRNLVSETLFPAGENTVWWDGTDDLGRDVDAVMHGVYKIPERFVEPGDYRVRGLVHDELKPRYEFSVYTTGSPPWNTADGTGAWLANHSAPQAAVFVPAAQSPTGEPAVYLGCYVTEGPAGLAWVDLDGHKRGGKRWVGGNWTAAPYLARDAGAKAASGTYVYVASVWETGKKTGVNELRVTAITSGGDKPVLVRPLDELAPKAQAGGEASVTRVDDEIGRLAVNDGLVIVSLTARNALALIDARGGKSLGLIPLESPHGLAFDAQGRLLALSGARLVRFVSLKNPATLPSPQILVSSGLEAPVGITLDEQGNIYVGDRGASHQVKVFSAEGRFVRAIGKPGTPKVGPYDPLHMQNPAGLAIDSKNRLWVAEQDFLPKRVSVWTLDGKLVNAFYGPAKYGGGGALDPKDKTKFYYADEGKGAMEFKLDWTKGTYELINVYYRRGADDLDDFRRVAAPETALYHDGRRYFTNCYNSSPTSGSNNVLIYAERDGIARPVAALGRAADWPLLATPAFKSLIPEGVDFSSKYAGKRKACFFLWSDLNGDGQIQPEEVVMQLGDVGGITVMPDLSFCVARLDGKTVRFAPSSFDAQGVPRYDLAHQQILAEGVLNPRSSGGDQALVFDDGSAVVTLGVNPFSGLSVCGMKNGVPLWSYPNLWPGLHASHRAPRPDRPGQLIGMTRMPGGPFEVAGSDVGQLWALHSNHGRMAIFTHDGLFVANLFTDMRSGNGWRMPAAERNMDLSAVTLGEENFWPTLTNSSDGKVYLVDGSRSAIVRIDGMDTIRRLPDAAITVTKSDLDRSRAWQVEVEAARQRSAGSSMLAIALRPVAPVVDGKVSEWPASAFVEIDKSGVKANFNATSKPYDVSGAVAVSGGRLYAAWRTDNPKLLENTGEMPLAPFKTGGALDLMIGADPQADPNRKEPVPGDVRLLVTMVKGKPWALLYRGVVLGTKDADKVPFSSPWRTITLDRVDDVTSQIEFAAADGNYELSIPLAVFGLRPVAGMKIQGDIGILRGNGTETIARVYWNNKATGITADVPAEAALTPSLWGVWEFKSP